MFKLAGERSFKPQNDRVSICIYISFLLFDRWGLKVDYAATNPLSSSNEKVLISSLGWAIIGNFELSLAVKVLNSFAFEMSMFMSRSLYTMFDVWEKQIKSRILFRLHANYRANYFLFKFSSRPIILWQAWHVRHRQLWRVTCSPQFLGNARNRKTSTETRLNQITTRIITFFCYWSTIKHFTDVFCWLQRTMHDSQ